MGVIERAVRAEKGGPIGLIAREYRTGVCARVPPFELLYIRAIILQNVDFLKNEVVHPNARHFHESVVVW